MNLPLQFRVRLNDQSLQPDLAGGDELHFDQTVSPRPGDLVLLRDALGNHFVRMLRAGLPGHLEAVALNPAYATLDVASSKLITVAVCVGEVRNRRRSDRI
jgi:hypothetical protein